MEKEKKEKKECEGCKDYPCPKHDLLYPIEKKCGCGGKFIKRQIQMSPYDSVGYIIECEKCWKVGIWD